MEWGREIRHDSLITNLYLLSIHDKLLMSVDTIKTSVETASLNNIKN